MIIDEIYGRAPTGIPHLADGSGGGRRSLYRQTSGPDTSALAVLRATTPFVRLRPVHRYRLHDCGKDDLGTLLHPAPNLETGDGVMTRDGRHWRVERFVPCGEDAPIRRLLEVVPDNSLLDYPAEA